MLLREQQLYAEELCLAQQMLQCQPRVTLVLDAARAMVRNQQSAEAMQLLAEYAEKYANPYAAAERGYIDDVIDPAETRSKLIAGLKMLQSKREELPRRKHGNMPL